MLGLGLFLEGRRQGVAAPTDIAWAGSHSVPEDAALSTQVGGALSATDPDAVVAPTFSLVNDGDGKFAIGADGASIIVAGVLDFETSTSHSITIRAVDANGLIYDEAFTVTVTDVSESAPENPLPPDGDADVDDAASFEILPTATVVDGGVKIHGKKAANGSSGKFLYDVDNFAANTTRVLHYTTDWSLLTNGGKNAFIGFGAREGNAFDMVGLRGDGATGVHKVRMSGDSPNGWSQLSGHTVSDGGAAQHGSQAEAWIALTIRADGTHFDFWTSAAGVTFDSEYANQSLGALASLVGNDVDGIAAVFAGTDTGPFAFKPLDYHVVPAPTVTSASAANNAENATLAHALTANQTVTWSLPSGSDAAKFELSGSTLRWAGNGTKNFESPDDSDTNNTYAVTVRATNVFGQTTDQTVTVTVTNVAEPPLDLYTTGLTSALSMGRQLLTSYGGSFYTDTGGFVSTWFDQAGSGRDMTSGVGNRPAVGTVGSRTVADFTTPSLHVLAYAVALSALITNSAGTIVWVGTLDALQASQSILFRDLNTNIQMSVPTSTSQASAYNDGGAVSVSGAGTAVTLGTPCVITWRHSGGTLYCSVNGAAEVSAASGNTASLANALQLGYGGGGGVFGFDGKLEEFYTWNVSLSPSDLAAVIQQAKTYVGI